MDQEGVERREGAQRDAAVDHLDAAQSEQDHHGDANQCGKGGEEQAPGANQLDVLVHVIAVGRFERGDLRFLLHVGANHAYAREIFLRAGGEHSQRGLDSLRQPVNSLPKKLHRDDHEGHRNQHK